MWILAEDGVDSETINNLNPELCKYNSQTQIAKLNKNRTFIYIL